MVYKQSLQEWIDSFQTADVHTTDRHITDFSKQEISKKEWIKKGFLIAESCIEYIRSTDYRIFVYIGFALKNRRKPFIPDTLSLITMDKWTPPFIILSKTRMENEESYTTSDILSKSLQRNVFFWQYKEKGLYLSNVYIAIEESKE
ncbi:hypothetical protein [Prevotella melaninogenica]|uniref:hypothetical protein n=1 Tax=Prevotella melaninogenica TaxID=28132 RepID=UPI001C5EA468|nr:hypothetical protein [Prevotella melaninogenica]MBW4728897.1 hypothetical protein [Prevotella melaninogenica]MBW4731654.1 hypothetical protein [Prevotella melaninogenica]MBW4749717.1 hypothetical protein [Prevotella melaninogenica]